MDASRLKSIPLFADLSDHERGQVARWADEVQVPEGKHLADQGEFAYEFFVIEEGSAVVTRNGERLKDLGAGDFFGEIALLETDRRTATVTASSPMRLIVMHARDFREMASEMPHVAEKIRAAIRERMAKP